MSQMPLFPLNTVLFTGGTLPLRIFEPRYLDMVGECMRESKGFGVVLIREGRDAGKAAAFHAVGTVARVVDFDQLDDGMLGITCRGEQMLHVQDHQVRPDQLIIGDVELLAAEPSQPVPDKYSALAAFLRTTLQKDEAKAYLEGIEQDWQNASWIGCRLAELLPLTPASKQTLLETDTPGRLEILHAVLKEHELLD